MAQSPRHLMAVSFLVAALFLAMNAAVRGAPLVEWWLPLVLFVLGIAVAAWLWVEERAARQARTETPAAIPEMGVRTWEVADVLTVQPEAPPVMAFTSEGPVDKPEVPIEAIVEPSPVIEAVESDSLPPETAILEHVQVEQPPETEVKPAIAIVDVELELAPPTEPIIARQPIAEIEAAAEKVAADIKENADQIQAMLKTESAERMVDAMTETQPPQTVTEVSGTIPEIAVGALKSAAGAVADVVKSAAETAVEKIGERLSGESADLPAPAEIVEVHAGDEAAPVASAVAEAEEHFVDTQERSDATASWVGVDDAARSPADPGENINLSEEPNPFVEGFPKPEQSEFSGMAETAALEHEKRAPSTQPDDLTVIEGIGHKMAAALKDAGIDTFAKLAQASEGELRAAIEAAGMRLAPTLRTWPEQAAYAERGDWDGLKAFQQTLRRLSREKA